MEKIEVQMSVWDSVPPYATLLLVLVTIFIAYREYKSKLKHGRQLITLQEAELRIQVFESLSRLLNVIENRLGPSPLTSEQLYSDLKGIKNPSTEKEFKACFDAATWQATYGRTVQKAAIESVVQLGLNYPFVVPTIKVAFLDFINQNLYPDEIKDGIQRLCAVTENK